MTVYSIIYLLLMPLPCFHSYFSSNSYVHHTQCISEQEKYSGGNFKPKASTVNKKDKQGKWRQMIQNVALKKNNNRTPAVQNILDFLAGTQAVPNKEKAFWVHSLKSEKSWF